MGKLHELLAVEQTVTEGAAKLLAETNRKFSSHTEFFSGNVRTLRRLNSTPEDTAIEQANRKVKELPSNVPDTLSYVFPFLTKALDTKLQKHATNQIAKADIVLDGVAVMHDVPVDFLLDLEKQLPQLRAMFQAMPTLDPSKKWVVERANVYKLAEAVQLAQNQRVTEAVVLFPATEQHPAQVKEAARDVLVGLFSDMELSGAATSQQKADVLALCDKLLFAVKQARMRANSVEIVQPKDGAKAVVELFAGVFAK